MENQALFVAQDMVVSLDYELTVDGQVVDTTRDASPIQYIQGHRNIIAGLESRLAGMAPGESRQVTVPSAEAYGAYNPEALADVPREQFPADFPLNIGAQLRVRDEQGGVHSARIAEVHDDSVRLDLNHPMAGKDLTFTATVVAVRPATEDEIAAGRLGCASCSSSGGCNGTCS